MPAVALEFDEVFGDEGCAEEVCDAVDGELVGDGCVVDVAFDGAAAEVVAGERRSALRCPWV